MDRRTPAWPHGRSARIRSAIERIEARIRRQRDLLWHPRLELAAAREIADSRRHLEALRRRIH
jgi:hypothetical protein